MSSPDIADPALLRLVDAFDRLGSYLRDVAPDAAYEVITEQTLEAVPSAEAAGITVADDDAGFETVAPTGPLAPAVDAIQYEVGSGPCVDAAVTDSIFRTGNLSTDPRWPAFGRRAAAETGVLSMLALRMYLDDDDGAAALNLYSTEPDAFDEQDRLIGLTLVTYGAMAVTSARRRDRVVNLERALATNRDIGVAIGVLMALHRVTREQAFDLLRMASQARHRKLADIAQAVAKTGTLDAL